MPVDTELSISFVETNVFARVLSYQVVWIQTTFYVASVMQVFPFGEIPLHQQKRSAMSGENLPADRDV